jgi:twitching motility protein PilT
VKPIDELLRNLRRPEVLEFALASDRLPCVKVGASFQPVDGGAPSTDQVLEMLVGAGGSRYVDSLNEAPTRWSFRLDGVGVISISAVLRSGVVQARFTLTKREVPARSESATMRAVAPTGGGFDLGAPGAPAKVNPNPPPSKGARPEVPHPSDDDEPTMVSEAVSNAAEAAVQAKKAAAAAAAEKSSPRPAAGLKIDRIDPLETARSSAPTQATIPKVSPGGGASLNLSKALDLGPPPAAGGKFVPPPPPPLMGSAGAKPPSPPPPEIAPQALVSKGAKPPFPRPPDDDNEVTEAIELDIPRNDKRNAGVPSALGGPSTAAAAPAPGPSPNLTQTAASSPAARAARPVIPRDDRPAPEPMAPSSGPTGTISQPDMARIQSAPKPQVPVASPISAPPPPREASPNAVAAPAGLRDLLTRARNLNASDLHLISGRPTLMRIAGELASRPGADAVLSEPEVEKMVRAIVPARLRAMLEADGSCDFAFDEESGGRVRANVSRQRSGYKISLRLIPAGVPSLASLGLPDVIASATHHHQGLIVVTGPTGHGKTSTLAALVDQINRDTTHHIITVEDPIEYVHPRKRAMMSQREVGTHTRTFASALKASLRQDPDVIVVGELRDTETVRMALSASETGHLVLGTMNTPSAAKTIDRLIDLFPPSDQAQVRATLAGGLRMVVSQRLLPASDGQSMVAAAEILPGSIALYTLIRDNKTFQIPSLQQRGRNAGMLRLDESLADLVRAGKTTLEYARAASEAPEELEAQLRAGGGIVATMVSSGGGGPSTKQGGAAAPAAAPPAGAPAARAPNPAAPAAASPAAPPVAPPGDKRAPAAGGGSLFQRAGSLFNKKEG